MLWKCWIRKEHRMRDITKVGCLWLFMLLLPQVSQAVVDKVIYDDYASVSFSQMDFSWETSFSPYQGNHAIVIQPDYWHSPALRLAAGRTDFRPYDLIEFFIRSPYAQISPQFWAWDYADSNIIQLDQYTQGGVIDATWRKVSIPIKNMISPAFAMDSVFLLGFKNMVNPYAFYIDNIVRTAQHQHATAHSIRNAFSTKHHTEV